MATTSPHIQLIVFDLEGTLTGDPTLWEIMHRKNGTWDSHGQPYWEQYKAGEIQYDEFARMDVATWKGAPAHFLNEAANEVPLMPGCRELINHLKSRAIPSAIVSNGLECLALRLAREFGVARVEANRATIENNRLTGELVLRVPFNEKAAALARTANELNVPMQSVMAIGDGTADIQMFRSAGHSVAFCPHNEVIAAAAGQIITEPDLRKLIPLIT